MISLYLSKKVYVHRGDEIDSRNYKSLQAVVVCNEQVDACVGGACEMDGVGRRNSIIRTNAGIPVGSFES